MRDPHKYDWWEHDAPQVRTHVPRVRPGINLTGIVSGIVLGAAFWCALWYALA